MIGSSYKGGERMTIWQRLDELNMSRYQLSKACGLPWAAVSDICRGKLPLSQCDDGMLDRLANSLQLSTQALLDLETDPQEDQPDLESGLPGFLRKSIHDLRKGELAQVSYLDCLYDDLYGSINSAQWGGEITKEQADNLRKKYLFGESQEDEA